MPDNHPDKRLDVSGLLCPLPVLRARKALAAMAKGQVIEVIATDPMSMIDMPHFCHEQGHDLLKAESQDRHFIFLIRRAAIPA